MRKILIIATLGLFFSVANAQVSSDGSLSGQVYNRYGQNLERSGDGWIVPNEARIVARFNFDPDAVEGWREPWQYVHDRIRPEDMKRYNFETYEYKSYPDYTLKMDVYHPKGQGAGPFPFVLIIHGGGWTTGHEKTPNMVLMAEWFSSNGITCMSVSYTLSGQGVFQNTVSDLNDALKFIGDNAQRWNVDPARFGFYGFSAGGHLSSYMAMTTPETSMFIAAAGPGDMTRHAGRYNRADGNSQMARYWGVKPENSDAENFESLRKASPIFLIPQPGSTIPPALIIQGQMDAIVAAEESTDFASELMKKGAPTVEYMGLSYAGHVTVNQRNYQFEDLMFKLLSFAHRHLLVKE